MQETYEKAIAQILKDEGGYTNNPADPGGPTNHGITIHDAQAYWKHDATAEDVRTMPVSVAEDIYRRHYADSINYNRLPAGVDYAVLDYAVNSGVARALKVLKEVQTSSPSDTINKIYDERLAFLQTLHTWPVFRHGWTDRCTHGRAFALSLCVQPVVPSNGNPPSNLITRILNLFKKGNTQS